MLLDQENPQAAIERGLSSLRIGALQRGCDRRTGFGSVELAHPGPEGRERERSLRRPHLERYRESRDGDRGASTWSRLPKPPTVFRQTRPGFTEELLERLENMRTQESDGGNTETVTKETVTQTE